MDSPKNLSPPAEDAPAKDLPSRAAAVHEVIRAEGEQELSRDAMALLLSAFAGGLSMSFSMLAEGILHSRLPDNDLGFLLENTGYTVGFLMVILARQQLFTENTITAVLPVMSRPSGHNLNRLLRFWGVVLFGNIVGTAVGALAFLYLPLFDAETHSAFVEMGGKVMDSSVTQVFAKGLVAGWLIATLVWLIPAAGSAKIWVILIVTYLIAILDLTHIIAGSTEVFYRVFSGKAGWADYLFHFALPILAGNVVGGTFIFALISHAQIRSDMNRD